MAARRAAVGLGLAAGLLALMSASSLGEGLVRLGHGERTVLASTLSVTVPADWQRGQMLAVTVPSTGQSVDLQVPQGVGAGEKMLFQIGGPSNAVLEAPARAQSLASVKGPAGPSLKQLTLGGMLQYERAIRKSMGKMRNTWKKLGTNSLANMQRGMMLEAQDFDDAKFIPVADAPKEEGYDKKNPNGFGAMKADADNINGVPGYTYTTDGTTLDVADQGEGYYQVKDPEHQKEYLRMLQLDCFGSKEKWRDHNNCASLIHRSHHYANADMFRFSGAFGWNPPFPPGQNATNLKGAMPPDHNSYWNYGSDEDFDGAALWTGKKFKPAA
mmetsp:Transcript_11555/g.22825  ORF Transcript_11555/g.22825 Transcript_11555/m.22825 type:complete len:328 (-) Transcript_11555:96-1079(-)|eukprot:CAMPEP_0173392688 /NCGR_PEP_ID=MMETSP1356-20130122/20744_1 /TAXON_ID=77927 ORGANISM="Hemiselmis virescens, Strain PCC157" /NCGR_SAMPLE_ID=MMETSP1356 /ASSEMBLY_ACC=CAM_ASM_000847 /LENGTH=327 /DNA_ID=CAMNT_0014350557 /DNA_START=13 /DNA_END=996 /DNA_ORIENTATION=+